jgi:autotransporter-associated beta strand protein
VGTNPLIVPGNNGAIGNPASGTVANAASATVVTAQTFTPTTNFNLGAFSFVETGGASDGAPFNNVSIHLFALNSGTTGSSGGYTLSTAQVGSDLLGGGSGLNSFTINGTGNSQIDEFDFSGADQVALNAGTTYAFEIWDDATGPTFYLSRNGGVQTYSGGALYQAQSPDGLGDDNEVSMSTVARVNSIAPTLRDLVFAVYPSSGIVVANSTWTSATGGSWSTGTNWSSGIPTNKGDSAYFGAAIAAPSTVTLDGNHTVGTVTFNTGASYTIAQGTSGTLTIDNGPVTASIDDLFGNHTISAPMAVNSVVQAAVGQATDTLTLSGGISGAGGITVTGNTTDAGVGTVLLGAADSYTGGTTVTSGTLIAGAPGALPTGQAVSITGTATLQLGHNSGLQTLSSLSIATGSTFDINNDHVIINYTGTSPGQGTGGYLQLLAASAAAGWTGTGIISTAAAATPGYGIAYGDGSDKGVTWLASGTIKMSYTLYGDIDQNGGVNGTDFGILAANFGKNVTGGWENGDFNYDGKVNATDFGKLAANFGKTASGTAIALPASQWAALDSFAAANGLLADVPEPASASLALLMCGSLASRRRRPR